MCGLLFLSSLMGQPRPPNLGDHGVVVDGTEKGDWSFVHSLQCQGAVLGLCSENLSLCQLGGCKFFWHTPPVDSHCSIGTKSEITQRRKQRNTGVKLSQNRSCPLFSNPFDSSSTTDCVTLADGGKVSSFPIKKQNTLLKFSIPHTHKP